MVRLLIVLILTLFTQQVLLADSRSEVELKFNSIIFYITSDFYINVFIGDDSTSKYFISDNISSEENRGIIITAFQNGDERMQYRLEQTINNYSKFNLDGKELNCYSKTSGNIVSLLIVDKIYSVFVVGHEKSISAIYDIKSLCGVSILL